MTGTRPVDELPVLLGPELQGAACKGRGNLWDDHLDPQEPPGAREDRHRAATDICWLACPIRIECLTTRTAEPTLGAGVWGGQLFTTIAAPAVRKCACGTPLPAGAPTTRIWCTDACGERHRRHNRDRTQPKTGTRTITCACGTTFTTRFPHQKHCSTPCRERSEETRRASTRAAREKQWVQLGHGYCHRRGCVTALSRRRLAMKSLWCSEKCRRVGVKQRSREQAA